jgi:hypothetical protein
VPPANVRVRLDLNSPTFQEQLFALARDQQHNVLLTLRKLWAMSWDQVYRDTGLRWEAIHSYVGAKNERLYSLRVGKAFRAVCCRDGDWLRVVSLHPDHDSAYGR